MIVRPSKQIASHPCDAFWSEQPRVDPPSADLLACRSRTSHTSEPNFRICPARNDNLPLEIENNK